MDLVKERAIPFLAGLVVGVAAGMGIHRAITPRGDKKFFEDSKIEEKAGNSKIEEKATEPAANAQEVPRSKVIFVLGGPGSGKGTYCGKMSADKGYPHFSAGDLLRAERSSGSELGNTINGYISEGALVPAEITVQLLRNAMEKDPSDTFLIDGFPRNQDNYDTWARMCADIETLFIMNFECPEEELIKRALARTEGRDDDTMNVL